MNTSTGTPIHDFSLRFGFRTYLTTQFGKSWTLPRRATHVSTLCTQRCGERRARQTCFVKSDLSSEITATAATTTDGVHLRGKGRLGGGAAWWRPQHGSLEAGCTGGLDEHAMCWNAGARHGELVPSTCRASGGGERPRVWVVGRAAGRPHLGAAPSDREVTLCLTGKTIDRSGKS